MCNRSETRVLDRVARGAEFLALKHESGIIGHLSNPVWGFSMMERLRFTVYSGGQGHGHHTDGWMDIKKYLAGAWHPILAAGSRSLCCGKR